MYYPCSENKGADQLHSYCEADLRLCFRIGKNPVFSRCGSFFQRQVEVSQIMEGYMQVLLDKDSEPENDVEMKMQLTMIGQYL